MRSNSTAEISSAPIRATTWLELSLPQFDPEKKTNPRTKTMMTANSVHLSWWKLARMVLSIRGSFWERATIPPGRETKNGKREPEIRADKRGSIRAYWKQSFAAVL